MGCNQYIRQKLPVDDSSGFSGYLVLGDTRIDLTTGNIYNLTGSGIISGFVGLSGIGSSGASGASGFSGIGYSGFSGQTGTGIQEKELENTYQNYSYATPTPNKVGRFDVLDFMTGVQNAVDFSFEVPEDIVLGNDLWLVLDYDISTSQAALVRIVLTYDVIDNNQSTTPPPTLVIPVLISPPAAGLKSEFVLTIPAANITSKTQSIRMTLLRDGSNILDSHGGAFRLGAISLRYVGLGGAVGSGSSGTGVQDDLHLVWSWMGL